MKTSPDWINRLEPNQIFVFGSNLLGIHGKGAAKIARQLFGAQPSEAIGRTGQCYAIPTKRNPAVSLPLPLVAKHVAAFLNYATDHPELEFLLTEIGCGLAGRQSSEIAPMFRGAPGNVLLPVSFVNELTK